MPTTKSKEKMYRLFIILLFGFRRPGANNVRINDELILLSEWYRETSRCLSSATPPNSLDKMYIPYFSVRLAQKISLFEIFTARIKLFCLYFLIFGQQQMSNRSELAQFSIQNQTNKRHFRAGYLDVSRSFIN